MVALLSEIECLLPRAQYLNAIKVEFDNRHKGIFYSLKGRRRRHKNQGDIKSGALTVASHFVPLSDKASLVNL